MDKNELLTKLLKNEVENETLEWKECKQQIDIRELGKYFSALSNEANLKGGSEAFLILGVKNNREIVGTSFKDSATSQSKLKLTISQGTGGVGFIDIHEIFIEEKRVLVFEIPAAPAGQPVSWQGFFYARSGESLIPLSIDKMDRIRGQLGSLDWSSGICVGAGIEDLDIVAIQKARDGFINKNPSISQNEINSWDDITFLNKAKITINGKITRAAILLLGKSESEHFLKPGTSKISWILKDSNGIEKDYQHYTCPLILTVDEVYKKVRNLRYRYISNQSLFPDEIDRYDPITIREAVNNCIAHQDYNRGGKINVIENEDDSLVFSNLGLFIPGTIENVIDSNSPSEYYRNPFLADVMVSVNMIDTIGSGIRKMFLSQKEKFFPMPEYDLTNQKVQLTIIGKVLDVAFAKKLVQIPDLDLKTIMLLDKVQKRKKLAHDENKYLRQRGLIEGRYPNIYISSYTAKRTGDQSAYMKRKGIEDDYARQMILDYLSRFGEAERSDLEEMLLDKFSDILSLQQKKDKVKNLLQALKSKGIIDLSGHRKWKKL